jgi:hypothetical protein
MKRKDSVKEVVAMARVLTEQNLHVTVLCDGPTSLETRDHGTSGKKGKGANAGSIAKVELQRIRSKKRNSPEKFNLQQAENEMKELEKIVKTWESGSRNPLPPNFVPSLQTAIAEEATRRSESADAATTGNICLLVAKFQVDTVICYRLVHGFSHLALTTDADYYALAGKMLSLSIIGNFHQDVRRIEHSLAFKLHVAL